MEVCSCGKQEIAPVMCMFSLRDLIEVDVWKIRSSLSPVMLFKILLKRLEV